jgi:transcription antitermination factor NusB
MGKRRQSRELAMKVLFSLDYFKTNPEECFDLVCNNFDASEDIKPFSRELVLGVFSCFKEIDTLIDKTSKNWRLERIGRVDRAILRLAIYEFLKREDIPPKVSINEAVDLGKKFGGKDSGAFINGLLDKIYNTIKMDPKEMLQDHSVNAV